MKRYKITILKYNDKSELLEYAGVDYGHGPSDVNPGYDRRLTSPSSALLTSSFYIDWGIAWDTYHRLAAVRESFEFVAANMVPELLHLPRTINSNQWIRNSYMRVPDHNYTMGYLDLSCNMPEAFIALNTRNSILRDLQRETRHAAIQKRRANELYRFALKADVEASKTRQEREKLLQSITENKQRIPLIRERDAVEKLIIEKYGIKTTVRVGFFLFTPSSSFKKKPRICMHRVAGCDGYLLLDLYDPSIYERFEGLPICPMLPRSIR